MQQCTNPCTDLSPQLEHCSIFDQERFRYSAEDPFTIVFNLKYVKEDELIIDFPEDNLLKLKIHHSFRNVGRHKFKRDCVYLYQLPQKIEKHNLTATWTDDDFLIIKEIPKELEREKVSTSEDSACNKSQQFQPIIESGDIRENNKPFVHKNDIKSPENNNFRLIPKKSEKIIKPLLAEFELNHHMKDIDDRMKNVKRILEMKIFETASDSD